MSDDADDFDDEDWHDTDHDPDDVDPVACPECGSAMYDDLDKCPKCGYWLTAADRRSLRSGEQRPAWQRVTAVVLIAVLLLGLVLAGLAAF